MRFLKPQLMSGVSTLTPTSGTTGGRWPAAHSLSASTQGGNPLSSSQPIDPNLAPIGVGKENSPDADDPDAAPIVDLGQSDIQPDPAYKGDVPVGTEDADEDARRAGGSR